MRSLAGPFVKLAIFALVTILASYVLIATITNAGYGKQNTYRAVFSDVTGLVNGDEVRIAGVRVGQVKSISLASADKPIQGKPEADVEFQVQANVPLPSGVLATIKYRNLVGQRYIALTEGHGSDGRQLPNGGTIPLAHTKPALDLTVLFGGFKPLLQALNPADMNRLSYEVIQVFQGEGGTVEDLLAHVASLTSSLADKDKVIGSVIDNLTAVLGTVAQRDQEFSNLIVSLQQFVSGLAQDRDAIFNSLQSIDTLESTTSGFLAQARPPLAADIKSLGSLATNVADTGDQLQQFLQMAPRKIDVITRTAINGSWFNFYLCGVGGHSKITLPAPNPATNPNGIPIDTGTYQNNAAGC